MNESRLRLLLQYIDDVLVIFNKGIKSRAVEEDKLRSIFEELLQTKREINKLYE